MGIFITLEYMFMYSANSSLTRPLIKTSFDPFSLAIRIVSLRGGLSRFLYFRIFNLSGYPVSAAWILIAL
ncbi:hypothetical protein E1C95_22685 [Salmonella enterica subsp. enterica serovar Bonariensis]|nr:hypothetical protein [Salmonella enterica subsp. enterica serovar Bonariensis]